MSAIHPRVSAPATYLGGRNVRDTRSDVTRREFGMNIGAERKGVVDWEAGKIPRLRKRRANMEVPIAFPCHIRVLIPWSRV
jgi:hypothetical protein